MTQATERTRVEGPLAFAARMRQVGRVSQGVSLEVRQAAGGAPLLRFDCYDEMGHYHYDPAGRNERIMLDPTLVDSPRAWALDAVERRLAPMLRRAGHDALAARLAAELPEEWYGRVREMVEAVEREDRRVLVHVHGEEKIAAGNLVFGLQCCPTPVNPGIAIHVLARVDGGEWGEVVCFDCFDAQPHYHYSPLHKNIVLNLDPAVVPDSLEWSLAQLRAGRLPRMLERAGYPEVAAEVDPAELDRVVREELEPRARAMTAAAVRAAREEAAAGAAA